MGFSLLSNARQNSRSFGVVFAWCRQNAAIVNKCRAPYFFIVTQRIDTEIACRSSNSQHNFIETRTDKIISRAYFLLINSCYCVLLKVNSNSISIEFSQLTINATSRLVWTWNKTHTVKFYLLQKSCLFNIN